MSQIQSQLFNNLTEDESSELLSKMFDYQNDQHKNLVNDIQETRNVANYIVVAVFAFTASIFSSFKDELLSYQIGLLAVVLLFILTISILMNWSFEITVGFKPDEIVATMKYVKKESIYDSIFSTSVIEYNKARKKLNLRLGILKRILLLAALTYFILMILMLLIPNNFNLNF